MPSHPPRLTPSPAAPAPFASLSELRVYHEAKCAADGLGGDDRDAALLDLLATRLPRSVLLAALDARRPRVAPGYLPPGE